MKKYDYLLFDLDGTLTESGPGIMNAAKICLEHLGKIENDESMLKLFVGPPLDKSLMERYGYSKEQAWEGIRVFRSYYDKQGIFENSLYPGISDMLKQLKADGRKTAIASSKPQKQVHRVLEHFNIRQYFDVVVGCELDGTRSTKDEVIEEVLRLFNLSKSEYMLNVLMIGDRSYDVLGAAKFGIPCIGVAYGYGTKEELLDAGAVDIADTVKDLKDLLTN